MALDAADWTVAVNGDVRWTGAGTATNVTVLEFHRWLQDLADDAIASGDDLLDITNETPSDRATDNIITLINGYNIDDTAAQHIYDGSIEQGGGDTKYRGLVVVGAVEALTEIQIEQNGARLTSYWGAIESANGNPDATQNILLRIMVKTRADGANIDGERLRTYAHELGDTYAEFSVTMGAGNNTAALFTGPDLNNPTAAGTIATYDQFTNTEGYQQWDVNNDTVNEDYYSGWTVDDGATTPASPTINDLFEWTKYIVRRGSTSTIHAFAGAGEAELFRGITHQWNYDAEGGTGPATNEDFSWGAFLETGAVTGGPFVVGEKVTGGTSGAIGRVLSVDATDTSLVVDTESGTWNAAEVITGTTSAATATTNAAIVGQATGGGRARMLAIDDNGVAGTVWVQLLVGTTPADNAIMYESTDHTNLMTVDGSITSRTLSSAFLGVSTGSAIIGAYGIGIDTADLTQNDQLFDLTNTLRVPPNNVTFTVAGLVSGEDRVLVGPETAGGLDRGQFLVNTALTVDTGTSIVVKDGTEAAGTGENVETDTPSTGTIRLQADDGVYYRIAYTAVSHGAGTTTFTVASGDVETAAVDNDVYISYIDELASGTTAAYTAVYAADRALFVRARDGGTAGDAEGIKTFETPATMSNSGGSATVIRTSDV